MRVFSGDFMRASTDKTTTPAKKLEEKKIDDSKSQTKSSEEGGRDAEKKKAKKDRDSSDLISFSVSIPRRSKRETQASLPTTEEDGEVSISRDVSGDNEPPLKRRRRSMMNKKPAM
jgi:minor histocompatibility antigen H13